MAKLGTYFGLCPLIDHRSLLGISADAEIGNVIVTLGKNISVKYKISDQKQLHSWRTKEKFSSPVLYDTQLSKYVAVFNQSYIKMWSGDEEYLDKLKKIKFGQQIFTIFTCKGQSFIVFNNGVIYPLQEAIDNRKELNLDDSIDPDDGYIIEVLYCSLKEDVYVGLIVQYIDQSCLYWKKFSSAGKNKCNKIIINRKDFDLKGYVFHTDRSSVKFLSLWNDGRVFAVDLADSDEVTSTLGELFTVIQSISSKEYVSMLSLDQNYIAMYGCNSNEEGALLVVYNAQFKLVQLKQPFKLFTNGAKLWCVDINLFFPVGQNLAVIPFYLETEQLAALVGSHKVTACDPDADVCIVQKLQEADWGCDVKSTVETIPKNLSSKLNDLLEQGVSEQAIFESVLPDFIEQNNVKAIAQLLSLFSDVPEKSLVAILKFTLDLNLKAFANKKVCAEAGFPKNLQPLARAELLDLVFAKPFNETFLLPNLRACLTVGDALTLLEYLCFFLSESGRCLPGLGSSETEAKLIGWCCVLIDSNYQRFLVTRDERVESTLKSLKSLISEEINCFDEMKHVLALMDEVKRGNPIHKIVHLADQSYSIEEFPLY